MFDLLEDIGFDWESNVPATIRGLSRLAHNLIWSDMDQDLCARAVWKDWRWWRRIFGERHCNASFAFYHARDKA